ncbi:MAG: glycosyltransferase [Ilumatobacteraceae bacterium]
MTYPFIRVVILAFDGADMTLECIDSVVNGGWPEDRMEIVLVDNGSLDDVVARTRSEYPMVRIIEPLKNTGFAAGCNLGISATQSSDGTELRPFDHVALVNNDAAVTSGWLDPLVMEMAAADDIGAVCPKILLAPRFIEIQVSRLFSDSPGPEPEPVCITGFRLDGKRSDSRLSFDEGFSGPSPFAAWSGDEFARWTHNGGCLRIIADDPNDPVNHRISLRVGARVPGWVKVRSDRGEVAVRVGVSDEGEINGHRWLDLDVGSERIDVINNAGSEIYRDGSAGDRGFLERDHGQYDQVGDVASWCGGAVLLRKEYLDAVGLFDESLFLYYEDTDLSWRGRLQGWRYRYAPSSVVRHRHAQSSGEGSELFRFQVERNRLLVLAKNAPLRLFLRSALGEVRRFSESLVRDVLFPILVVRRPRLSSFRFRRRVTQSYFRLLPGVLGKRWLTRRRVRRRIVFASAVDKKIIAPVFADHVDIVTPSERTGTALRPRAAVYNLYWDTYGGGEIVSGEMARVLSADYDVTILGPVRPDVEVLRQRLGIDLSTLNWRCAADDEAASRISSEFDLFVNCTFLSTAANHSRMGVYYVNFPARIPSPFADAMTRGALRLVSLLVPVPVIGRKASQVKVILAARVPKSDWTKSYSLFLANSTYVQTWITRIWGRSSTVVYPPVRTLVEPGDKVPVIASVGRFFDPQHGHSKKQLELVRGFGTMSEAGGIEPWRLCLVGGADAANRDYVMSIRQAARGLPIDVHVNARRNELEVLIARASIYWHAGGFGEDEQRHPDRFEHFGISVVEAMAAGAVPVVFGAAGPAEIVRHGVDGFHWRTLDELQDFTRRLIQDPDLRQRMATSARTRAAEYSPQRFEVSLRAAIARCSA